MAKVINTWHVWALVAVLAVLGYDVASDLFNFPVRLGMLRLVLLFGEQSWQRLRM